MGTIRLYKDNETVMAMREDDAVLGVDISEYAIDIVNTQELYSTINRLTFKYPYNLPYVKDVKQDNFVKVLSNGLWDLFVIIEVNFNTDEGVFEVYCDHYTTIYAAEPVPDILAFGKKLTALQVADRLNASSYKSGDYNIRVVGATWEIDLSDYAFGNQSMGQLWTGESSFFRKHYGVLIQRDLQGITIFNPSEQQQGEPLVLGVNIREMDYTLEEPTRYSVAMLDLSTVPDIEVPGTGLSDFKLTYIGGIAQSKLTRFSEIDAGDELWFFYRGILIFIRKTPAGNLEAGIVQKPRLVRHQGITHDEYTEMVHNLETVFKNTATTPFDGGRLQISLGAPGNEYTFIDEALNLEYLRGYRAFINYSSAAADPNGLLGTEKYFGFIPEKFNGTGDGGQDITYTYVDKELFKRPIVNPDYEGRGGGVFLVEYERTKSPDHGSDGEVFYDWFLKSYPQFWGWPKGMELNRKKPNFKAVLSIDELNLINGIPTSKFYRYWLGNRTLVIAEKQGLEFESEVTKVIYNVSRQELTLVEFGNKQEVVLDKIIKNNEDKARNKRVYRDAKNSKNGDGDKRSDKTTNSKPVIKLHKSKIDNSKKEDSFELFRANLESAHDKEDGDLTSRVKIRHTETEATYTVTDSDGNTATKTAKMTYGDSELGWTYEDYLNSLDKPLQSGEDLFGKDFEYEARTDDSGIPYFKWEVDVITLPVGSEESTTSKLLAYNGAEAVLGEVAMVKDAIGKELELEAYGSFTSNSGRTYLPDNNLFAIVPNPTPEVTTGRRKWPVLFNPISYVDGFNVDTVSGTGGIRTTDLSLDDFNLIKEELGTWQTRYMDYSYKGRLIVKTKEWSENKEIHQLSKSLGNGAINGSESLLLTGREDFIDNVIYPAIGQTVSNRGNQAGTGNSTLHDYIETGGVKKPEIRTPYYRFIKQLIREVGRPQYTGSAESGIYIAMDGIMEVHWEQHPLVVGTNDYTHIIKDIIIHWDLFEKHSSYVPLVTKTQAWQGIHFTQPTTKVDGKTVKMPYLILSNGGPSVFNSMLNKTEIDKLWATLTPEQRKEFEGLYGDEREFRSKTNNLKYAKDDLLLSFQFKDQRGIKLMEVGGWGDYQNVISDTYSAEYKLIERRTQQKHDYLIRTGHTVTPGEGMLKKWDELVTEYEGT